jgi:Ca2+-binding EF-hand superfamily protein
MHAHMRVTQVSELKYLAPDATEAELQDMLGEVDADGSGSIELPEFITMMVRKLKPGGDNEEDRTDALRAFYDKNGANAPGISVVSPCKYCLTWRDLLVC